MGIAGTQHNSLGTLGLDLLGHTLVGSLGGLGVSLISGRSTNATLSKNTNKITGALVGALTGLFASTARNYGDNAHRTYIAKSRQPLLAKFEDQDTVGGKLASISRVFANYCVAAVGGNFVYNILAGRVASMNGASGLLTAGSQLEAWYARAPFAIINTVGTAFAALKITTTLSSIVNKLIGPAEAKPVPAPTRPRFDFKAAKPFLGNGADSAKEAYETEAHAGHVKGIRAAFDTAEDAQVKAHAQYLYNPTSKLADNAVTIEFAGYKGLVTYVPLGKEIAQPTTNGSRAGVAEAYKAGHVVVFFGDEINGQGQSVDVTKKADVKAAVDDFVKGVTQQIVPVEGIFLEQGITPTEFGVYDIAFS